MAPPVPVARAILARLLAFRDGPEGIYDARLRRYPTCMNVAGNVGERVGDTG